VRPRTDDRSAGRRSGAGWGGGVGPWRRRLYNVEVTRRRARRTLPRPVFDYVDGGADDEETMRRNLGAFRAVTLQPKMASGIVRPTLGRSVVGEDLAFPVLLAPCGFARVLHPDGEAGAARAASRLGLASVLSTAACTPLERVAADAPGARQWFQLYFLGGRQGAAQLVGRAEAAGYSALVVTIDTAAIGNRERDVANRVPQPLQVNLRTALVQGPQMLRHPRWLYGFVRDGMPVGLANAAGLTVDGVPLEPVAAAGMIATEPPSWDDLEWLRARWGGPLVVKGLLTAADAVRAVEVGADAVVVSNHGGRQLDGVAASLDALPEVVDAVGARTEVLLDSGVRRGSDVVKALALGARAVLLGRPYLWGLACGGEAGVEHVLRLLRTEIVRTLKLLGCASVDELDGSFVTTGEHCRPRSSA
jgi:L-lactate dehydrogenase (cytochrome)